MRIMGIDPGGGTGICVWTDEGKDREVGFVLGGGVAGEAGELLFYDELYPSLAMHKALELPGKYDPRDWRSGEYMVVMQVFGLVEKYGPDLMACEDFVLREGRHTGDRVALSPVRLQAQIDLMARVLDVPLRIVWQQASLAKTTVTDERLRSMGLWVKGGKGHHRDAIRHAVTAYKRVVSSGGTLRSVPLP
jgi:hypothetical protein